jgi:hypothetical protein
VIARLEGWNRSVIISPAGLRNIQIVHAGKAMDVSFLKGWRALIAFQPPARIVMVHNFPVESEKTSLDDA